MFYFSFTVYLIFYFYFSFYFFFSGPEMNAAIVAAVITLIIDRSGPGEPFAACVIRDRFETDRARRLHEHHVAGLHDL